MQFAPAYFVDHFSPAPAWHERAIPCPHAATGMTVDTFFDMGKTPPVPFDVGTADKVWGFDPEGNEVIASFGKRGIPMADCLIPGDTSETPAICTKRGGKYGIHNDWALVVVLCRATGLQIPINEDSFLTDQNIIIFHIVRVDTPALSKVYTALTAIEDDRHINYCGLDIMAGIGSAGVFVDGYYGFPCKIYPDQGMGYYQSGYEYTHNHFDCRSAKNLYGLIKTGEASDIEPDWENDNPANLNTRLLLPFPYDFE